jgi:ABC-type xylose transport system substrate-binding protein
VPSYLLEPISLGVDQIDAVLVQSGYYTADQLK